MNQLTEKELSFLLQLRFTHRRRFRRVRARMIPMTLIRKTRPAAAAIAILSTKEGIKRKSN